MSLSSAASSSSTQARHARGFTLIELVMVIVILGVLAAVALPRFVALQRDARVAKVEDMAGRLMTFATQVRLKCSVTPTCNINAQGQTVTIGGAVAYLHYGWIDAGDTLGESQIDRFITAPGWTVSISSGVITRYALGGAPDPANCAARYHDSFHVQLTTQTAFVTTLTTGC